MLDNGHYNDLIMSAMGSQITGVSMVCSTICSGADQRKCQSSVSLAFVRGIHRWPEGSPHKGPVSRKKFPFDDIIMACYPVCHTQFLTASACSSYKIVHAKISRFCNLFWSCQYLYPAQLVKCASTFLHARPWIPGDEKSIFTVVIH